MELNLYHEEESTSNKIKLPTDHITSEKNSDHPKECQSGSIPENEMGMDIGEKTRAQFDRCAQNCLSKIF